MSDIKNNIIFLLMGFVVFSSFDTTLCTEILHLPQLLPELLLVPFFPLLKDKFKSLKFDKGLFQYFFISWVLLLMLALLIGRYEMSGILSMARSLLYLLCGICLFNKRNDITNDDIQWLTLGSILGWLYDSYHRFGKLLLDFDMENLTYGLLLAFPLFFSIVLYNKRYVLAFLGLVASTGIFVFSGLRRVVLVFIVSLAAIFILQMLSNNKKIVRLVFISILFVTIVSLFLPRIESYVYEVSPDLHYRMFGRTERLLENNSGTGDQTRINNISDFEEQGLSLLFPHGIYTNHTKEKGAGLYTDFPFAAISWTVGLPLACLIVFYCLRKFIKSYMCFKKGRTEAFPFVVSAFIMFILLFLDGTFMSYVYCAPITGMCLGRMFMFSK